MAQSLLERLRGTSAPEEVTVERRRNVRHTTVFQVARIITPGWQELCILRNVSPGGLKAEIYIPATEGERVTIELKTGHCLRGKIVWTRDQFIGVQFDEPVPMMSMLTHCSLDDRIERIRPPRIEVDLWGTLRIDHEEVPIRVSNISQAGLKFSTLRKLRADARCEVQLDELGWKRATVRWCRDSDAGVMLVQPLLYPEFAHWRRRLHETQAGEPTE
jgi:hypothetical protein